MSETPSEPKPTPDCVTALRALAEGALDQWRGLPATCTRGHAERALGSPAGSEHAGSLGGSPTMFTEYPAHPGAPRGVTIWHVDDRLVFARIQDAVPRAPIQELLGAPEATMPSRMRRSLVQHVHASRGLTLHVHRATGEIAFLMGYAPMSLDEYRGSWISQTELRRIPMQR